MGPSYLKDHLLSYIPTCPLRSQEELFTFVLREAVAQEQAFSAAAPKLEFPSRGIQNYTLFHGFLVKAKNISVLSSIGLLNWIITSMF